MYLSSQSITHLSVGSDPVKSIPPTQTAMRCVWCGGGGGTSSKDKARVCLFPDPRMSLQPSSSNFPVPLHNGSICSFPLDLTNQSYSEIHDHVYGVEG